MQLSLVKMTLSKECEKHRLLTCDKKMTLNQGHILGARNLPYPYLRQQYGELRKDFAGLLI